MCRFFAAFDDDRPSLLSAYAPICTFSFFADTTNPIRARAKKVGTKGDRRFPHQHKLDWKPYLGPEGSRNLLRAKNPGTSQLDRHADHGSVHRLMLLDAYPISQTSASPRSR